MYTTLGMFKGSGVAGGGTYPTLVSRTHGGHADGTNANRIVAFPGGITAGQLIVIAISTEVGGFTISAPSGFTRATSGKNVFYKVSTGGETSATCVVSSSGTATNESALVFSAGTTQVAADELKVSSSSNGNPPSLTVPWGAASNLFMAVYHSIGIGGTVSGYPSNCTLYRTTDTSPQYEGVAGAESALATFDPDAFTSGSGDNNTFTIGLN
jgi:hypothetical protein